MNARKPMVLARVIGGKPRAPIGLQDLTYHYCGRLDNLVYVAEKIDALQIYPNCHIISGGKFGRDQPTSMSGILTKCLHQQQATPDQRCVSLKDTDSSPHLAKAILYQWTPYILVSTRHKEGWASTFKYFHITIKLRAILFFTLSNLSIGDFLLPTPLTSF